ncbi:MAG: hypothetical protein U0R76_07140 [Candidatus Nanopelagicales bacterium]
MCGSTTTLSARAIAAYGAGCNAVGAVVGDEREEAAVRQADVHLLWPREPARRSR